MKANSKGFVIFIFSIIVSFIQVSFLNAANSNKNSNDNFVCPVDSGIIISNFGNMTHPLLKIERHHDGIDIKAPQGFPVYASADGDIRFSGINGGYGKTIKMGLQ